VPKLISALNAVIQASNDMALMMMPVRISQRACTRENKEAHEGHDRDDDQAAGREGQAGPEGGVAHQVLEHQGDQHGAAEHDEAEQ